ncbi:MAG: leucyl/phenylalanyl-tRNA--protein transferase [Bacteroidetes bacterium]|nr:leucyl/phenylalanyl-tRNA--protein transferase [Bacteroidota bacterium]
MCRVFLTPEILLRAYMSGAFPMAHPEENNDIFWHMPETRGLIPLDHRFHVPKNLAKLYRSNRFDFTINRDFEQVITACSQSRVDGTWISDDILELYTQLHEMGYAHSFETRLDGELVGGLYGVAMGKAFFGESMFHHVRDASKLALVFLVEFLRGRKFQLLDTQYLNPHLLQFGAYEISAFQYKQLLAEALKETESE